MERPSLTTTVEPGRIGRSAMVAARRGAIIGGCGSEPAMADPTPTDGPPEDLLVVGKVVDMVSKEHMVRMVHMVRMDCSLIHH